MKKNNNYTHKYNIVLKENDKFILASCKTLKFAKKYLKEMIKTDKQLANYYNWQKIPKYKIIKKEDLKVEQ